MNTIDLKHSCMWPDKCPRCKDKQNAAIGPLEGQHDAAQPAQAGEAVGISADINGALENLRMLERARDTVTGERLSVATMQRLAQDAKEAVLREFSRPQPEQPASAGCDECGGSKKVRAWKGGDYNGEQYWETCTKCAAIAQQDKRGGA